jgi:hypothetical protein
LAGLTLTSAIFVPRKRNGLELDGHHLREINDRVLAFGEMFEVFLVGGDHDVEPNDVGFRDPQLLFMHC